MTHVTLRSVWARVHKIDRIRPQPGGGGIVLVEDERNVPAMARVPGLSTVNAVARVLNARRALEIADHVMRRQFARYAQVHVYQTQCLRE